MKRLVVALALVAGMYGQKLDPGDTGGSFLGRRGLRKVVVTWGADRLASMRAGKLTQADLDHVLEVGNPDSHVETMAKFPRAALEVTSSATPNEGAFFQGVILKETTGMTLIMYEDLGKDSMTAVYYSTDPKMTRDEALVVMLKYFPLHSNRRVH